MRVQSPLILLLSMVTIIACKLPAGYIPNPSLGIAYKMVYQSKSWPDAKEVCEDEGAQLAIPKKWDQFEHIQKLVRSMHHPSITDSEYKLLVWLGINNLDDYRTWKNVDGENIENTEFHKWATNNGHGHWDAPEEPHCAGIDAINPGLRDFWCHRKQPFICQIKY